MDKIDILLWTVGGGFTVMFGLLITMWHHFNQRFDKVDKRFEKIDNKFEKVDQRFEKLEEKVNNLDCRLSRIEGVITAKECCILSAHHHHKAE